LSDAKRIVLAGGSGFLGRSLCPLLLSAGYQPVVLTRLPAATGSPVRSVFWDGKSLGKWATELDGARAVINLTGKSVNCRYTPEARREILASRVDSVRVLGEACACCTRRPEVWIQAGSLAIYGNAGDRVCTEESPPGSGFSVDVCRQWESAFNAVNVEGMRKAIFRIGFALAPHEGALRTLEKITRFYLGGRVGSGRQFISWIHIADLQQMFIWALENHDLAPVYIASGPSPVTNAEFMGALRHALHRPWSPPVPAPFVRLGALAMGTEPHLALHGFRCLPKRFLENGFRFHFPLLQEALSDLYSDRQSIPA
jgi:uncharacterized protein